MKEEEYSKLRLIKEQIKIYKAKLQKLKKI